MRLTKDGYKEEQTDTDKHTHTQRSLITQSC